MRYLHVRWIHSSPTEPVEIFSEVDDEGYEVRKVEVFPDGHVGFADDREQACTTELGEKPVPDLEAIAADPQFQPRWISKEDFEKAWTARAHSAAS
jgi:hypothetical protein